MRKANTYLAIPVLAGLLALSGCSVTQTEEAKLPDMKVSADAGQIPTYEVKKTREGEMPDVDVDVKKGNLPKYDVDVAEVEVKTETKTVEVPDVDVEVKTENKQIEVPDVDITMPEEKNS